MLKRTLWLALLFVLFVQGAAAQYNNPTGRVPNSMIGLSVGGKAGTTIYFGDLVDGGRVRWTASGYVEKTVMSWMDVRGEVDFGQCHGGQKLYGVDALDFSTTFFDLEAFAKFRFLDLIQGFDAGRLFNPYFAIGGGAILFSCKKNPGSDFDADAYKANVGNDEYADKWLYSDNGMQAAAMASGIVGVRFAVSEKVSLLLEYKGDILFTDDFDGHQGWPAGGTEWVDSDGKFDALWTVSLGAQYRFYNISKYQSSSKYSRKNYLRTRKAYERNAKRMRRR